MPGDVDGTIELTPTFVDYELNPARFVLEPSIRLLRWPVLRGRFSARRGHLVLGEGAELGLELDAGSLRTNVFGLAGRLIEKGALCAEDHPAIHFRSTELLVVHQLIEVTGRIEVLDAVRDVTLKGRLVDVDDAALVWMRGVLPPPRRSLESGGLIARLLGKWPIHVELAAEFVR